MRANLYISILIGILIFIAIQWYITRDKTVEAFETTTPSTNTITTTNTPPPPSSFENILATLTADPTNFKYVEEKEKIPGNDKLLLYYSSFSDKTIYGQSTYIPDNQRWNNHITADQTNFLLTTNVLPVSIKPPHGLSLKGMALQGIPSDKLNSESTALGSFSASFYCRFNSLTFTGDTPIEIFNIYLESPNYAIMKLAPSKKQDGTIDPDYVDILLQVGNQDNIYTVKKPKDALLSSGNYVLITFVYDDTAISLENKPTSSKVYLYIGNNESDNYNSLVTPKPNLILGNTPIKVNSNANLDINLQAFAFYNTAIPFSTHKLLLTYFNEQQSGVRSILEALKALSKAQLTAVQSYVQSQAITLEDLQKQLETCKASVVPEEKGFPYGIKLPATMQPISDADLEKCSILSVKKRKTEAAKEEPPATTTTPATTPTTDATAPIISEPVASKSRFFINIPFLSNIIGKAF